MDTRNRTRREETPVRVVRIAPGLRFTLCAFSVLGVAFFGTMTGLALYQWAETAIIVMPLFVALSLYPGIYALRTEVRLYRDRLVVAKALFSKKETYRDIARAGLFPDDAMWLLVLEGKRTLELTTEEYRAYDLEAILEFVRDARRDLGYAKLEPSPEAVVEQRRKKAMYVFIGAMAVALIATVVFAYLE